MVVTKDLINNEDGNIVLIPLKIFYDECFLLILTKWLELLKPSIL